MAHSFAYIRTEEAPTLPPPAEQSGWIGWFYVRVLRALLDFGTFSHGVRAIWTLIALLCLAAAVYNGGVYFEFWGGGDDVMLSREEVDRLTMAGALAFGAALVFQWLFGISRLGWLIGFIMSVLAVGGLLALVVGLWLLASLGALGETVGGALDWIAGLIPDAAWDYIEPYLPMMADGDAVTPTTTTVIVGAEDAPMTPPQEALLWSASLTAEAARAGLIFYLAAFIGILCVTTDKETEWGMLSPFVKTTLFLTITVLISWAVLLMGVAAYDFLIANAVFSDPDGLKGAACRPEGPTGGVLPVGEPIGACWPMIKAKLYQFTYGFYPREEVWRVNVVYGVLAMAVAYLIIENPRWNAFFGMGAFMIYIGLTFGLLTPEEQASLPSMHWLVAGFAFLLTSLLAVRSERWLAAAVLTVFPLAALVLLNGVPITAAQGEMVALDATGHIVSSTAVGYDDRVASGELRQVDGAWAQLSGMVSNHWTSFLGFDIPRWGMGVLGLILAVVSWLGAAGRLGDLLKVLAAPLAIVGLIFLGLFGLPVAVGAFDYGLDLEVVDTSKWGGLLLTLVVALTGIVASLPLGVLLALGRRSTLPVVRILSTLFIEFWRGVPLITVLFMSSVMLPFFLPEGVHFNKLLRALIGVALFASAYMAEVVRGGLQAIPKGQYEGGMSLGLGYWQQMRLIIMPQALTLVIPGIVNTFIGLFKDTTLVLIIGMFDLLGIQQATTSDPDWAAPTTAFTGYFFVAAVFWAFCFGMSRYSQYMERKLYRGH